VETADNGHQCLERLKTGRRDFDVLITDLQMPVMDGFTSVREYRAWEEEFMRSSGKSEGKEDEGKGEGKVEGNGDETARLYIIGMSANSDEESVKDALAAGMDDFVMKPFNYEVLAASLVHVVMTS
jgi:CheY-like chemotaxis protein